MDVRVEAVDGRLPEDCHISVRVGDVQKQTQYDAKKLYRFPEARRFGKVDIYQRIGTCDLAWGADQPEMRTCKAIGSQGDTGIKLKLSVARSGGTMQKGTDAIDPTAVKAAKAAQISGKAKVYLQDNDVEGILTGAMRALLKSMPNDAPTFLCNYITHHYNARNRTGDASAKEAVPVPPTSPPQGSPAPRPGPHKAQQPASRPASAKAVPTTSMPAFWEALYEKFRLAEPTTAPKPTSSSAEAEAKAAAAVAAAAAAAAAAASAASASAAALGAAKTAHRSCPPAYWESAHRRFSRPEVLAARANVVYLEEKSGLPQALAGAAAVELQRLGLSSFRLRPSVTTWVSPNGCPPLGAVNELGRRGMAALQMPGAQQVHTQKKMMSQTSLQADLLEEWAPDFLNEETTTPKFSRTDVKPDIKEVVLSPRITSTFKERKWCMRPSVGTWLTRAPLAEALPVPSVPPAPVSPGYKVAPEYVADAGARSYTRRPSVGTWMGRRPSHVAASSQPGEEPKASPKDEDEEDKPPLPYTRRPSVGTWMGRRPSLVAGASQPSEEPKATPKEDAEAAPVRYTRRPSVGTWMGHRPSLVAGDSQPSEEPKALPNEDAEAAPVKYTRRPSVGTWMGSLPLSVAGQTPPSEERKASPGGVEAPQDDAEAPPVQYTRRPSVGTWMGRRPSFVAAAQPSQEPEASLKVEAEAEAEAEAPPLQYTRRPSVGTWMGRRPSLVAAESQPK